MYNKTVVKLLRTLHVTDELLKETVDKRLLTDGQVERIKNGRKRQSRLVTTTKFLEQIPKGGATTYNVFKQVLRKAAESSSEIELALKHLEEKENEVLVETNGKQWSFFQWSKNKNRELKMKQKSTGCFLLKDSPQIVGHVFFFSFSSTLSF